jgi:hypothetical protein
MKRALNLTPVAVVAARMKLLPRQHRIAHLRALIRQSADALRRRELAALLRDEVTALSGQAGLIAMKGLLA